MTTYLQKSSSKCVKMHKGMAASAFTFRDASVTNPTVYLLSSVMH